MMNFLNVHIKVITNIVKLLVACGMIILISVVIYLYNEQNELKKVVEWMQDNEKEEEISRLNHYFRENYQYYIFEALDSASIPPRQVSVRELKYSRFTLVEEGNLKTYEGSDCFIFSAKKEAEEIYAKLTMDEKKDYCVVSKSIIYVKNQNNEFQNMIKEAQMYFNLN